MMKTQAPDEDMMKTQTHGEDMMKTQTLGEDMMKTQTHDEDMMKTQTHDEDSGSWYLATGDSYRTIAFSYRVGHATVAVIVKEVAGAIWTAVVQETMPHVVIQAPANSGSLYFNYKSTHSLVLLAVVDAQYLFRIVDVGGFGRSSDGGSLRNSAFGESLRDGSLQLPPDTVIPGAERLGLLPHVFVGDEAFPLLDNLLRPFPGRQLTRERKMFNYRLSRARLVVECAFGILSSQWRMFRRVITTSPETQAHGEDMMKTQVHGEDMMKTQTHGEYMVKTQAHGEDMMKTQTHGEDSGSW
ncbi:hypothetical protein JOQ06_019657 [Pogonophryne albipinna]|uniref:DDE Tnp4 domain-containing protein n=1 Tax=Pogonophryne albipinna TaxID=1090488 RepID=A0AAD6BQ70_9TELE|nr:hypothetical protein JOQ06_019657 [Pogonophryne albipinna]